MHHGHTRAAGYLLFAVAILSASTAMAVTYNETSGDLSNSGSSPTNLGTFGLGTHTVIASTGSGDQDDITFTIPAGLSFSGIIPGPYTSADGTSFMGLGSGSTITTTGAAGTLLGFTHFGTTPGNIGVNVMPAMGTSNSVNPAATGFSPPLGPGSYSVWMQQTGPSLTSYQMDFVVTPEPGSITLLGAAALGLLARRPRASRAG